MQDGKKIRRIVKIFEEVASGRQFNTCKIYRKFAVNSSHDRLCLGANLMTIKLI